MLSQTLKFLALLKHDRLRICVQVFLLLACIWLPYIPSLDSFFVADDIWQVNFAHNVIDEGRTELIFLNFSSNYLQLPSFGFYRPLLGFTFLLDYALWHTNAVGYHVTNLILYTTIVFLLFLLMRTLTRSWPDFNSSWASFFTALLFAASPLHCEDVTWISGRADIFCAPFYLASLYFVVRSHIEKKRSLFFAGLAGFALALMSKEIAIGLPGVIAAYYFIWPSEEEFKTPLDIPRSKPAEKKEKAPRRKIAPEGASQSQSEGTGDESNTSSDEERDSKDGGQSRPAVPSISAGQKAHAQRALKKLSKKRKKKEARRANEAESSEEELDASAQEESPSQAEGVLEAPARASFKLKEKLLYAIRMSSPFFALGAVYMLVRYNALGTFIGGYGGMMGGALSRHLFLRWIDPINLVRILLPFPQSVPSLFKWITFVCLGACTLILVLRLLARSRPWRWVLFLIIWMMTAILPLAKLWGVGMELETSRLLFFFTMAYCALWPVLLFHPPDIKSVSKVPLEADRGIGYVAGALFVIMSVAMSLTTYNTNTFWTHAGEELKTIWQDTVKIAEKLPEGKRVIVLGIPKDYKGAHVNFNGSTFHHMLRPPFVAKSLSEKVITFEPYIVGPYEVISSDRLKAFLEMSSVEGPYVWDRKKNAFDLMLLSGRTGFGESVELPFKTRKTEGGEAAGVPSVASAWRFDGKGTAVVKDDGVVLRNVEEGSALSIDRLDINPLEFDFIEFDIEAKLAPGDPRQLVPMAIGWNDVKVKKDRSDWAVIALHVPKLGKSERLRLHLSHFWQWYSMGPIKSVVVRLFDADKIQIKNARLVKADRLLPLIGVSGINPLNSGEYVISEKPVTIVFDASKIEGARSVEIEVTKPNFFFDNYLMGSGETAVNRVIKLDATSGFATLPPRLFKEPAYYEVRLRASGIAGKPVGAASEAVALLRMGGGLDTYVF